MSLVTGETDGGILLIANDDTFAHTYPDLRRLLEEQAEGDPLRGAVEFFDFTGRRLVPGFDRQWCLTDLQPSSEPADPAAVQRRLQAVLDHLERFLKSDSESGAAPASTVLRRCANCRRWTARWPTPSRRCPGTSRGRELPATSCTTPCTPPVGRTDRHRRPGGRP